MARWQLQEGEEEIITVKPSMAKLFLMLLVTLGLYLPWFIVRIKPVHIDFLRRDAEFRDALHQAIELRHQELQERAAQGGL